MGIEFPSYFNLGLVLLFFLVSFLWEYSVLTRKYEGELKFRSIKRKIELGGFIFAIAWTLFIWLSNGYFTYYILIFWCVPVANILIYPIYRIKRPTTIYIDKRNLILNNRWPQKRDLKELSNIRFDRFSKILKLEFTNKASIQINSNEYKIDDVKLLLETLINKSEHQVKIPKNYIMK